ncbi:hypothetical protein JOB18_030109 [Solea senegalensis]|uniref:Uncharacterized protein n=1 Tax=Solea senegalensis TaxID=28829 RepID=A0AAV6SKT2_SOLSE|nr:hypothetical protein JOB18_030109 [Solea senegalensis]
MVVGNLHPGCETITCPTNSADQASQQQHITYFVSTPLSLKCVAAGTALVYNYTGNRIQLQRVNKLTEKYRSLLIVSVSKVAWLLFDVQTPSSSQKRLTAGAEREADGLRQDAVNLTSLSPFQVLWFNQRLPHKLLWSTFEITVSAQ